MNNTDGIDAHSSSRVSRPSKKSVIVRFSSIYLSIEAFAGSLGSTRS